MNKIINFDDFKKIIMQPNVIIIAKTQGCNVCFPVTSKLKEMMEKYSDIPLYELYIEDLPEFRGQHLVFTVPTIIVFHQNKEIHRESRFINWEKLKSVIENLI